MAINSLSSSSRGLSGLASGMDTQQMVDAMLATTQNKIDTTNQKKTQLTYKQNMYRDISTKLINFQNSFFKYATASTNLLSPSFFNSMTATSTSSAFKATASSSANVGKSTVNWISQLAQSARSKSEKAVTGKLDGQFDAAKMAELAKNMDGKITFKSEDGTTEKSITIRELVGNGTTPNGALEIERVLKDQLGSMANVSYEGGNLMLSSKDGKKLTVSGNTSALKMFGLTAQRVSSDEGKMALSINPTAALPTLSVTVNGVKKSILFNPAAATDASGKPVAWTADSFAARMNETMQKAFGSKVEVKNNGGRIEFAMINRKADGTTEPDLTSQIVLAGDSENGGGDLLKTFGIASGKSNKINTGMTLAEANFGEPILGGVQKFTINGVDFSVNSSQSIFSVLDEINSSSAGVTVSYQSTEDKFLIESKTSGAIVGNPFEMSQSEGNLLTALFGAGRSSGVSTNAMTGKGSFTGTEFNAKKDDFAEETAVQLKIGNEIIDFNVKFKPEDTKDVDTFVKRLNEAINDNPKSKGKIAFGTETTGDKSKLIMKGAEGSEIQVLSGLDDVGLKAGNRTYTGTAKGDTSMEALGLGDMVFQIGGKTIRTVDTAGKSLTVDEYEKKLSNAVRSAVRDASPAGTDVSKVGAEFDANTGRYRIFGVDIPMTIQITGDSGMMMGTNEPVQVGKTVGASLTSVQDGQNAVAKINGVEIERTSNVFTVDGITYELRNTTPKGTDAAQTPVEVNETIEVTRDTDKIYDGIVKFVEEYNKLVDSINEQLGADASYRNYPPLTDKQKESMSDREVELWETKSKEGLLRNDAVLESVMSGLRGTLYTKPAGGMALYELGIQSNSYYGEKDHLTIGDPADLKKRIAENPTGVQALFTDTENGLAQLMSNAIDNAASTNSGKPGILMREAGAKGRVDTTSNLYKQMRDLDSRLSGLENTYESQYNRYWKQFNSMEQLISQMNQQSSWLTQQFA